MIMCTLYNIPVYINTLFLIFLCTRNCNKYSIRNLTFGCPDIVQHTDVHKYFISNNKFIRIYNALEHAYNLTVLDTQYNPSPYPYIYYRINLKKSYMYLKTNDISKNNIKQQHVNKRTNLASEAPSKYHDHAANCCSALSASFRNFSAS